MAAKLFIFYMLYFCIPSVYGMKQVPCVFFFGDSLFDNGNNNFLLTLANANYPPYGIDYPAGPTGRFSNGKNLPDFLAEFLGFDNPIPPFATATGANILNGVNYASGGAGILDQSGAALGNVMSLNKQLINHGNTAFKMGLLLGNATRATDHLNKCLYLSNMGNNDYLSNYLMPKFYVSSTLFTPQQFAEILINQYRRQLEILYKYGARITQQFYNRLAPLVHDLNTDLHAAQFIFINVTNFQLGDPSTTGIKVRDVPCCVVSKLTGLCDHGKTPCTNRNEYYFWDNYHPTETVYHAVATRSYAAASPDDAYPTDIRNLVRPH